MREFKFRMWDKHESKLTTPDWIDDEGYVYEDGGWGCHPLTRSKESCVLMQYTGLKDCSGVEVYEGDILKYKYDLYLVIYRYSAFILKTLGSYDQEPMFEYAVDRMEVIGNIFENPELLESDETEDEITF